MESEFLKERTERIEWGLRRVAAAFGVDKWRRSVMQNGHCPLYFGASVSGDRVYWKVSEEFFQVILLQSGDLNNCCEFRYESDVHSESPPSWECFPHPQYSRYNRLMARGLYRLGFTNESIFAQLPSLTAREKLEARLTLACEFWPQTWLDEGVGSVSVDRVG